MDLVDEQQHRLLGGDRFFEQPLETRLELAPHARAGEQRTDVEAEKPNIAQRRRRVAADDRQRQSLDHGGLSNASVAGQERIVLTTTQQDVDHLADLGVATDHRVDVAGARPSSEVGAVAVERATATAIGWIQRAAGFSWNSRNQPRAVMRSFSFFGRARDQSANHLVELIAGNEGKGRRQRDQQATQFRGLNQRGEQPAAADAVRAVFERGQHPSALDRQFEVMRKISDRAGARREEAQGRGEVTVERARIDSVVTADAMKIAVGELRDLPDPVGQFDEWIAAQLGKRGGRLDRPEQGHVQLAEQCAPGDSHQRISFGEAFGEPAALAAEIAICRLANAREGCNVVTEICGKSQAARP